MKLTIEFLDEDFTTPITEGDMEQINLPSRPTEFLCTARATVHHEEESTSMLMHAWLADYDEYLDRNLCFESDDSYEPMSITLGGKKYVLSLTPFSN